jgi:hypothetical protein
VSSRSVSFAALYASTTSTRGRCDLPLTSVPVSKMAVPFSRVRKRSGVTASSVLKKLFSA